MKTIGVIGLGSIGSRHAKNLKTLGHKVIGYDPKFTEVKFEEVLDTDAVVIASPTPMHADHIAACAAVPDIFCEKPIADHIIDNANNITMVGYMLRFHQCVQTVKGWILAGELGEPLWANFVAAQKNTKYTDPVVLNWSHEVDLALYLIGPANLINYAVKVHPVTLRQNLADLTLFHSNGCQSTVHLDYLTEPEIRQTYIFGSEASILIDLVTGHAWLRGHDGKVLDHKFANESFDQVYLNEMETFLARCDGAKTIGCTSKEALEVLDICLAVK